KGCHSESPYRAAQVFGGLSIGWSVSTTCAQVGLRFANSSTSLSPLIHTSAFLARTGSAPSTTWPAVVMSFAFGNKTGMRGSSLPPATTENVTLGSLKDRKSTRLNSSHLG